MTKPVLVVGAGPVGLTMAAELARYRVPVRIIDKAPARTDKSKALVVWPRTLELLDRAGCADAFMSAGVTANAAAILSGQQTIARIGLDHIQSPFNCPLMLPQSETERLLDEHLASLGATVERNLELISFVESADGVTCTCRHADGRDETIEASWLVGCDGAHSLVRNALGLAFEGDTLATNFILADVHVEGLSVPGTELAIFWHHEGVLLFFPLGSGRYRIIADVGSQARHDPSVDEVQAIVHQRGADGTTISDPVWLSGFSVNERKVKDYRVGRVFVAGDAAHIHSPAGGQGMNTGMQDAINLAWKLAIVEHGHAGPAILDSYSAERSPVAEQVLAESGRMTRVGTVRNRLLQDVRNFVAHHVIGLTFVQHAAAEQLSEITFDYRASPLNAGSAKGLSGPQPGQRIIAERPFGSGDRPCFTLMASNSDQAESILQRHAALLEPDLGSPPDEAGIWLVRPDGYVAAVARAGDFQVIADFLASIAPGAPQTASS
jgi:2-polyprenyl-6-methoxyphenol hydroxylase-like FAD-dependent oxidoreductase